MSLNEYDEACVGCRPAVLDVQTGKPFADDSPQMKAVMKMWEKTSRAEREAFHRVCCQNSRNPGDLGKMQKLTDKIKKALS